MQKELFELGGPVIGGATLAEKPRGWWEQFQITLRIDHLFILAISGLVLYVLVFSFGMEKGKRFALDELKAEKIKREEIAKELQAVKNPIENAAPGKSIPAAGPQTEGGETGSPFLSGEPVGKYTIQIVTYLTLSRAQQEVDRLKEKGHRAFAIQEGKFFYVCIEAFQSTREAGIQLSILKKQGFAPDDAYIRPLHLVN